MPPVMPTRFMVAAGATVVDTTGMGIDDVVAAVVALLPEEVAE